MEWRPQQRAGDIRIDDRLLARVDATLGEVNLDVEELCHQSDKQRGRARVAFEGPRDERFDEGLLFRNTDLAVAFADANARTELGNEVGLQVARLRRPPIRTPDWPFLNRECWGVCPADFVVSGGLAPVGHGRRSRVLVAVPTEGAACRPNCPMFRRLRPRQRAVRPAHRMSRRCPRRSRRGG